MKKKRYFNPKKRIKIVLVAFICVTFGNLYAQNYGDFPYEESFLSGTKPNDVDAVNTTVKFTTEGLQLTPAQLSTNGAVFIKNRLFTSELGINLEFEYMIHGGTGGDGFSVFLFDRNATPRIGAKGAGIGYAYNLTHPGKSDLNGEKAPGLNGAYLGIAFDIFGNYKGMRFQNDSRVSGIPYGNSYSYQIDTRYNTQNHITLRGAQGAGIDNYQTKDYSGYPVLISQATTNPQYKIILNDKGNNVDPFYDVSINNEFTPINISGGGKFVNRSNSAYRKAFIELFPAEKSEGGGFYITVKIEHNGGVETIIKDYHYKEEFDYRETVTTYSYNRESARDPIKTRMNATVPESFLLGFAASTGEKTNYHVIKNMRITLPRHAEANDDYLMIYKGRRAELYPLENDIAYEGAIRRDQVGSKDHLDKSSFYFVSSTGTILSNTVTTSEGTWQHMTDANGELKVQFTPVPGFEGIAEIKYRVKGQGTPYGDEAYRSLPVTIRVEVVPNPIQPRNVISNKMVTSRGQ